MSDVEFVGHENCPSCGSRDNLARYSDGHAYCFGCGHYEKGDGTPSDTPNKQHAPKSAKPLIAGEYQELPKRRLHKATCERWRYQVGADENGRKVQIATYADEAGRPVAQKIRYADKSMSWRGDKAATGLYGAWLWRDGGKQVIVTEGELDALSVSQLFKWPVVSIPDGAQGAARAFRKHIDFFAKFEKVVLLFDNDEPGRKAAEECASILKPGQAYLGTLPLKDANAMLVEGRGEELVQALWDARPFRPDGIVSGASLIQKALKPVSMGLPWFDDDLTQATYGRRPAEVYMIGAGTGVGKTDLFLESIAFDLFNLGQPVGAILFEQQPEDTIRRLVGKWKGKRFHIPDGSWTHEELEQALEEAKPHLERLYLYDHFGAADWPTVQARLRYLSVACGCKLLYLDHLTALAANEDDERKALETITSQLAGFTQEQAGYLHVISHLATPEGKPHEEGGRVMIRHFKGSRAIGFWSNFMFGLERNQQAEDEEERKITTLRCLKDRNTGNATGRTFRFAYDVSSGKLGKAPNELTEDAGQPSDF